MVVPIKQDVGRGMKRSMAVSVKDTINKLAREVSAPKYKTDKNMVYRASKSTWRIGNRRPPCLSVMFPHVLRMEKMNNIKRRER